MPHGFGSLVAELKDALTRQRYNRVVVRNYCRNADYFLAYLAARKVALYASRINFLLSIPMLMCMIGPSHGLPF